VDGLDVGNIEISCVDFSNYFGIVECDDDVIMTDVN